MFSEMESRKIEKKHIIVSSTRQVLKKSRPFCFYVSLWVYVSVCVHLLCVLGQCFKYLILIFPKTTSIHSRPVDFSLYSSVRAHECQIEVFISI